MLKRTYVVNVVVEEVVADIISVENRTTIERIETSIGVRRKRKAKKNTKIILEKEKKKKKENRKESRLTLALSMPLFFVPLSWSVFDSSVTIAHTIHHEYRSQNIIMR